MTREVRCRAAGQLMAHREIAAPWRALVKRVVTEYRSVLGDDLLAVACFGSVARGEAGPKSDLDLCVVTRTPERADRVRTCLASR